MTVQHALQQATALLHRAHIESAQLDAEVLLTHIINKTRTWLLVHRAEKLIPAHARRFFALINRRAAHEPVAYLTGRKAFYGLDFFVNKYTLIPRPETETLIDVAKNCITKHATIIDIGTGSGAIAITLAKQFPRAKIFATDISGTALRVARKNAKQHNAKITFKKGDLLTPLRGQLSIVNCHTFIVANLPYLSTKTWRRTQSDIKKFEPRTALESGPDGLNHYRKLIKQIKKFQISCFRFQTTLILEIDPCQTKLLTTLTEKLFPNARMEIKKDLAKRNRVFILSLTQSFPDQTKRDDRSLAPKSRQRSA